MKENQLRQMWVTDVTDSEAEALTMALACHDSPRYLEVGTYFGGTFRRILGWLASNREEYWACGIDLFEDLLLDKDKYLVGWPNRTQTHGMFMDPDQSVRNSCSMGYLREALVGVLPQGAEDRFSLVKGYSKEIMLDMDRIGEKYDVIFIDGNHAYSATKEDYEAALLLCKVGSIIAFHNTTLSEMNSTYRDGGPYKVCSEIEKDPRMVELFSADTLRSFIVKEQ